MFKIELIIKFWTINKRPRKNWFIRKKLPVNMEQYTHSSSDDEIKTLIVNLTCLQIGDLADFLDFSLKEQNEGNFKDLAALYNFTFVEIEYFAKAMVRGQRSTEQLIRSIEMRYPDSTIMDLQAKCRQIRRYDVDDYLEGILKKWHKKINCKNCDKMRNEACKCFAKKCTL